VSKSIERFSSRVENYIKYRPGYPTEIIGFLQEACGLTPQSVVADIGSGTGKLTEILLENGNKVYGVEPNGGMRTAAEKLLSSYETFKSIDGTAEDTSLRETSIDLITAGQAFHWFDPVRARTEAQRILKPRGWVALIWNDRKLQSTPFLEDYEALLLRHGTDYQKVRHDKAEHLITQFFDQCEVQLKVFPNKQVFDFDGLLGRVLSSSYTPESDHPDFQPMIHGLKSIFEKHQSSGEIVFDYDTKVFYGQLE
jgi:SAM-dependent methyltransferase